jgi:hypothetical protein
LRAEADQEYQGQKMGRRGERRTDGNVAARRERPRRIK